MPGPYTLSGRLQPNRQYTDRWALAEALLPIVRKELESLVAAGCRELSLDEPSMSCYAHREDPRRFNGSIVTELSNPLPAADTRLRTC